MPKAQPPEKPTPSKKPHQAERIELTIDGIPVVVSPELEAAVYRAHKGLFAPLPNEMTTTQAADFLDVSRPFVIKLIREGHLPCRMVGKHRRIPGEAVRAYRETMFRHAKQAADEMARLSQEEGLYNLAEASSEEQ